MDEVRRTVLELAGHPLDGELLDGDIAALSATVLELASLWDVDAVDLPPATSFSASWEEHGR